MSKAKSTSIHKALKLMRVLTGNFAHGYSNAELQRATGLSSSSVCRYLQILIDSGFAERIQETDRVRPSVWFGQASIQIKHSLDTLQGQLFRISERLEKGDKK